MSVTGKIMLLPAGLAVIWPTKVYDIHGESFKDEPVLSVLGGVVEIYVGQMKVHCTLEVLDHLIEFGPNLHFYEDGGGYLVYYYGAMELDRDSLLQIKGALLYSLKEEEG